MSDRIFPTTHQEKLGPATEITTIDWGKVKTSMNEIQGKSMSKENAQIKPSNKDFVRTASNKNKKTVAPRIKKYAAVEDFCEECGVPHPCSHDVIQAQLDGDKEKYDEYLEIRAARRNATIDRYEKMEKIAAKEALNQRDSVRREILSSLEKEEEEIIREKIEDMVKEATEKDSKKKPKKKKKVKKYTIEELIDSGIVGRGPGRGRCLELIEELGDKKYSIKELMRKKIIGRGPGRGRGLIILEKVSDTTEAENKSSFQSFSKLSEKQKEDFVKIAQSYNWPKEYIEALFYKKASDDIPEAIVKIGSSNLKKAEKKDLIVSMFKEAKLSEEQKNRIVAYWRDELGYQDVDWIKDLVADPS